MTTIVHDHARLQMRVIDFLAEYGAALDEERFVDWVDYFTDDGTYSVTTRTNHQTTGLLLNFEAGREALKERAAYVDGYFQFARRHTTRIITGTRVSVHGDLIHANSRFLLMRCDRSGRTVAHGAGWFEDVLVDDGTNLKLKSHTVLVDSDLLPSDFTDLL